MLHRLLLAGLLCLGLAAQDTVVVFLRHAEKTSRRTNAELTSGGRQRAQRLVEELSPFQPAALFASELRRTQQTLEPLSRRLNLPLRIYARGSESALGRGLLAGYAGKTVVVCGHSDTLMDLVASLAYPSAFPEITGFDRFWILRVARADGKVTLEERQQAISLLPR